MSIKKMVLGILQLCFVLSTLAGDGGQAMAHPAYGATLSLPRLSLAQEGSLSQKTQEVDRLFSTFIGEKSPGAAVIVIQKGKVLYSTAYGLADLEAQTALTPQHIFHIGSVGKQFTALGIMLLQQEGKLRYDDPIRRYVPELPAWGDRVTIRHLLHHTSGLPDYTEAMIDALFARTETPTNRDLVAVLSQMRKLPTAPGETFEYSNPGYDLLGTILERVSGKAYQDFLQTRIFTPLGMKQTFSLPNPVRLKEALLAHSYEDEGEDVEPYDADPLDGLLGSGSIYSTVGDMYLYDQALYSDKIIKRRTLAEAFKSGILTDGSKTNYGFAFELETWRKQPYVAHSGAWLAFTSDYVRFPQAALSVVVLLNRNYAVPDEPRIGLQVAKIFLE